MTTPPEFDQLDEASKRAWKAGAEWAMAEFRAEHEANLRELRLLQDEARNLIAPRLQRRARR